MWCHGYKKNGSMYYRTIDSNNQTFAYNGEQMSDADGNSLGWDLNGQMTDGVDSKEFVWNWQGLLRSATYDGTTVTIKYDPAGNRVQRQVGTTTRKYIVDTIGDLPVILLELDGSGNVQNKYIYANSQILARHDTSAIYFYLHDRLGSVRQIINSSAGVVNYYVYQPFGEMHATETEESLLNPFKYTGQYFDSEFDQYYLRARQYEPYLGIFTANDPVDGKFTEPLSFNRYLYCGNDTINWVDVDGLWREDIHRSFGRWGWGYDEERGIAPFDYARLDIDKPANKFPYRYRKLHFRNKKEVYPDLLRAIGAGNIREFEYLVHQWQDTYTHYDRGHTRLHGKDPSIDDMDWSDPSDVAAYRACDATTQMFENLWVKSNIDYWATHPEVELPIANPWLSVMGTWSSNRYISPIYRQQIGTD